MKGEHLSSSINRRFIEGMEYISEHYKQSVRQLCAVLDYDTTSFAKVKRGERSLPMLYHAKAAALFEKYGISSVWFYHGRGEMLLDRLMVSEELAVLQMLRTENNKLHEMLAAAYRENERLREALKNRE